MLYWYLNAEDGYSTKLVSHYLNGKSKPQEVDVSKKGYISDILVFDKTLQNFTFKGK